MKNIIILISILLTTSDLLWAKKQIALTFDDAPRPGTELSYSDRAEMLLDALKSSGVEQVMFYVTTKHLNEETRPILDQYAAAGHFIGNHSDQHLWLHQTKLVDYQEDFLTAHEQLKDYPNFKPFFRYPYLDEGRDEAKHLGMQRFLIEQNYQNGYVTVDNYDWYLDKLFQDAINSGQSVNRAQLKQLYVDVLYQAIEFSDDIAIKYLGRSPKHVLLLHDNDLAAYFIDDLVDHLRKNGWEIISPLEAYDDPIAKQVPQTLFNGQGRVAALADEAGAKRTDLIHVAEDEAQLAALFKTYQVIFPVSRAMPEWFKLEMMAQVGTWQTSNAKYQSSDEPFSDYLIEWRWGGGKSYLLGRLYGLHDGKATGDFWTFKQYWDAEKQQARLIQFGHGGMVGDGYLLPIEGDQIETIQSFASPEVNAYLEKHLSEMTDAGLVTTSFGVNDKGDWQEKRSYLWKKQAPVVESKD